MERRLGPVGYITVVFRGANPAPSVKYMIAKAHAFARAALIDPAFKARLAEICRRLEARRANRDAPSQARETINGHSEMIGLELWEGHLRAETWAPRPTTL